MHGRLRVLSRLALPTSLAALGSLLASEASAHPPGQTRLPPIWTDPACMTIVDRSVDPVEVIEYTVLDEEDPPTEDEPPDSGTFQFIAFCRDLDIVTNLPNWITMADVEVAAEYGLINLADPSLEGDILEDRPDWAGCWARITPDDMRRPITEAAAMEPISWDTSMLAAGTWLVEGYTYEPWINAWSSHPGVFKIVDDPDPAASQPAAALTYLEMTTFVGSSVTLDGCVDAMPGSLMTLSWTGFDSKLTVEEQPTSEELVWEPYIVDQAVENGSFALEWLVPEEAKGQTILFKLDVSDPMGRSWTAHGAVPIGVAGSFGGDESGGESADESGESGAQDTGLDEDGSGGCSCGVSSRSAKHQPLALAWMWLGLIGAGLYSRRRAAHRRLPPHT